RALSRGLLAATLSCFMAAKRKLQNALVNSHTDDLKVGIFAEKQLRMNGLATLAVVLSPPGDAAADSGREALLRQERRNSRGAAAWRQGRSGDQFQQLCLAIGPHAPPSSMAAATGLMRPLPSCGASSTSAEKISISDSCRNVLRPQSQPEDKEEPQLQQPQRQRRQRRSVGWSNEAPGQPPSPSSVSPPPSILKAAPQQQPLPQSALLAAGGDQWQSDAATPDSGCSSCLYICSLALIALTFPFSLIFCLRVVAEYERAVVLRLGRVLGQQGKGPGLFFIIPCCDSVRIVDLRTVTFDVPPQEVLTKDSVTVAVDAVVYYRIFSPVVSVTNVEDADRSTRLLAQTTLRNVLGTKNLSEILSEREEISCMMQECLDLATDPWGVKVERVEIKDVRLPVQLQRAMAAEAEAAREARAKVIMAEGEQKASRALREAAVVIQESPFALQLRYLHTLNVISAEKNSTIIFPLPMEFLAHFRTEPLLPSMASNSNSVGCSKVSGMNRQLRHSMSLPLLYGFQTDWWLQWLFGDQRPGLFSWLPFVSSDCSHLFSLYISGVLGDPGSEKPLKWPSMLHRKRFRSSSGGSLTDFAARLAGPVNRDLDGLAVDGDLRRSGLQQSGELNCVVNYERPMPTPLLTSAAAPDEAKVVELGHLRVHATGFFISAKQFSSFPAASVTLVPSGTSPSATTLKGFGRLLLERQWEGSAVQTRTRSPARMSVMVADHLRITCGVERSHCVCTAQEQQSETKREPQRQQPECLLQELEGDLLGSAVGFKSAEPKSGLVQLLFGLLCLQEREKSAIAGPGPGIYTGGEARAISVRILLPTEPLLAVARQLGALRPSRQQQQTGRQADRAVAAAAELAAAGCGWQPSRATAFTETHCNSPVKQREAALPQRNLHSRCGSALEQQNLAKICEADVWLSSGILLLRKSNRDVPPKQRRSAPPIFNSSASLRLAALKRSGKFLRLGLFLLSSPTREIS
uniref:PHB domain-containing protein n=1 Tax=Macrostomum lignano TaxID=282301 RepID=A0A1I8IT83_9PLAT